MKTTTRCMLLAILCGCITSAGWGGTVIGKVGRTIYPTTYAPPGFNLDVYGDWIENIDRVSFPAGVSVSIVSKRNGAQNNTGQFAGRGDVTLRIGTSNATPGSKTISLINDPDALGGGETFTFTITVVGSPSVTSVDAPSPSAPFQDINVTLHGTGLNGATDPAAGSIVIDNLVPFITVGGDAHVTSVRVLSSAATALTAKISFSALIQDATVELVLKSQTEGNSLGSLISPAGFKTRIRAKSTNINNYIKSITFPNGSTIDKNSIGTINLNLLFPAPFGADTRLKNGLVIHFSNTLDDSRVFYRFVPANAFTKPDGTPFATDPSGFITATAVAGEDIVPVVFKVVDCLGGQQGQSNVVKIQTWMHTTNSNLPPNFIEHTFNVRCTP